MKKEVDAKALAARNVGATSTIVCSVTGKGLYTIDQIACFFACKCDILRASDADKGKLRPLPKPSDE